MSGASRTLIPCRCACSTTSSTVRSSKSASVRITSSGRTWSSTSGSSAREPSRRKPGTSSGATTPTNSYAEPASRCDERAAERHEALAPPHEHDAATDPRRAHELERDRVVCGPQQPDRHGGDEHRGRDEARGREVVAGADAEREHDESHDDEAGQDPSEAGPELPLAVETRLGEDEHRDRSRELQPLRRALAPEQAPEDVPVACDDLADHESEVDAEREPNDVERDEGADRQRPPRERQDRPAREQVQARRTDVLADGAAAWGLGAASPAEARSLPRSKLRARFRATTRPGCSF